jgi:hypothetical protein
LDIGDAASFFNFLGAPMILGGVFLAVNSSLHWLENVSSVNVIRVSLLLIGQQDLGHFFGYRPLLPIGRRIVQILCQRWRKTANTAPTTLSAIQASSQSSFVNERLAGMK